jgi:signal transduction histidine kinase
VAGPTAWRLLGRCVDLAAAAALFGLGVIDLAAGDYAGPQAGNAAFLAAVAVPVAWRRRYPVPVLAVVTAGSAVWSSLWYLTVQPPYVPFIATLLCFYAAAAAAASLGPLLGVAAFGLAAETVAVLAGRSLSNSAPAWILYALTVVLGRVVHRQRALSAALAERTRSLETEREETARLAVALERARIARELHDVITHNVSVIVVQAGVEHRLLGDQETVTESTRQVLATIEETGRDTLVELRRLLGVLRRSDDRLALAPPPTLRRLEDLVLQMRQAGLRVDLRTEGTRVDLPAGVELSAYRIVQEALTNVLRHASTAHAQVTLGFGARALRMDITDDGRGPVGDGAGGHGLTGMRERVALHGGTFTAGAAANGGYTVGVELPLGAS